MNRLNIEFKGTDELERAMINKSQTDFKEIEKRHIRSVYSRSQKAGGTPVDTNELRMSAAYRDDTMGYRAEHGPHVEYGHRLVNGGFVSGQFFLRNNIETERPLYRQGLINALRK